MIITEKFPKEYDEHPFAPFVRTLGKGKRGSRSLTQEEAREAMRMILDGEVLDLQLGAFLMLLRVKEESPEEIAGFVKACKDRMHAPQDLHADIDWSSYAGKRRHLPWFLLSTLLLAENGVRVFMHGASGHTKGRLYTQNVVKALNLPIAEDWDAASAALEQSNFCYMPLSAVLPRIEDMIQMRALLGLRSPVHTLARLLNPLNAKVVMQGIFHPPYSAIHQLAGQLLEYPSVTVIKGEGGEIERNPDSKTLAKSSANGQLIEEEWPAIYESRHLKAEELSVDQLRAVWRGEQQDSYGEGAVIGTLAIALKSLGKADSQASAMALATSWWQQRDRSRLG